MNNISRYYNKCASLYTKQQEMDTYIFGLNFGDAW